MPTRPSHQCQCPNCLAEADHPDKRYHHELGLFLATLSFEQRRLFATVESNRIGWRGVVGASLITGCCLPTIARGRRELADLALGRVLTKEVKPTQGRPRTEEKYPAVAAALEELLGDETAGDPMSDQKWARSSVRKLSRRLRERGFTVGKKAVWGMLRRLRYSLKTSVRRRRGVTRDPAARDEQFRYIAEQRKALGAAGIPVISVDTKKKELIGNFASPGRTWCKAAPEVEEHDFPSQAECVATPFGIYDVGRNTGYVVVSLSHNTSEFAVAAIARWWNEEGRVTHRGAERLLLLADGGGANGSRVRAWKLNLQEKLCDRFGLTVTVCHYPPGCSKFNPVERRLFSQISKNWEGKPLRFLPLMLGYIRGTTTSTGLAVTAHLDEETYKKGQKVMSDDMGRVNIEPHAVCPAWNYTITPTIRLEPSILSADPRTDTDATPT